MKLQRRWEEERERERVEQQMFDSQSEDLLDFGGFQNFPGIKRVPLSRYYPALSGSEVSLRQQQRKSHSRVCIHHSPFFFFSLRYLRMRV